MQDRIGGGGGMNGTDPVRPVALHMVVGATLTDLPPTCIGVSSVNDQQFRSVSFHPDPARASKQ